MEGTLVLGLGNLLLGDDGVGVHAARQLAADGCAAEVLEIGTALLDALPALARARRVVVIDALAAGGAPGSVYRLPFDHVQHPEQIAGLHGFDLSRVLALCGRSQDPPEMIVFGVEPARLAWSLELSPAVRDALPCLLEAVRGELPSG